MKLEQRREREREKYLALAKGSYGSTNHGKHAEDMIAAWKPKRIVDFGCGKNQFIANMRQRGIDGIGIDFAMAEADFKAAMHEVPLKADIADVVTSFDALEHLLPEDVDAVLGEMHRIAAPGGRFVFSIATSPSRITHNGENLHPTVKPIDWWRQKIEHFGNIQTMDRYIVGTWKHAPRPPVHRQINHHTVSPHMQRTGRGGRLMMYTGSMESIDLAGWYARRSVFLIMSGPSLREMDLTQLHQRGIMTMGVNNSWAVHRPQLWTCVDPPGKFHDVGWKDPGITKFVPIAHRDARLRVKTDAGTFRDSSFVVGDMPAVYYFPARTSFDASSYFDDPAVQWGNEAKIKDSEGVSGSRSCMLAALRLCHYLGFRCVFIVGADFRMDADRKYAFEQERSASSIKHNNSLYQALNQRFALLKRTQFGQRDFHVFNCTPDSGLAAFPHYPFEKAVEYARAECGKAVDTAGWYDSANKPKPAAKGQKKPLDERREHQRQKYVKLAGESPKYGATNHGREAIELVVNLKPEYVVDLGCGRNEWVKMLRERLPGVRAEGVDFAFDEADIKAPMHQLPLADNCADVVTAFDSLEHLLPDEVDAVLDEIARILKPGGTFIASICYYPSKIKVEGEGLHPTVQAEEWWTSKLARFGEVRREGRYLCVGP